MPRKYDKKQLPTNSKPTQEFRPLNDEQANAYDAYKENEIIFLTGAAGTGKAEPLDAIVYTPTGPRTMGSIECGDLVCTPDGNFAKVVKTFPQGKKDIFKITFADGDSVECCKEHLWSINDNQGYRWENKIVDTSYIIHHLKSPNGRRKLSVKTPEYAYFESSNLSINPYLLGLLMGDGCFVGGYVGFTSADNEIINSIKLSEDVNPKKNSKIDYVIRKLKSKIKEIGLWGCRSWEKWIPRDYIYTSFENRIALIQGLMDTDGSVDKRTGMPVFYTTSKQLSLDFKELIQSIGGICVIKTKQTSFTYKVIKKEGRISYVCSIRYNKSTELFKLSRKKKIAKDRTRYKTKRIIENVEFVGQKEAKCILIDHPDHLYLTNNFIVTHNTHLAVAFAVQDIIKRERHKIVMSRPIIEAGENLGFLPGDIDEKVYPYMIPLYDCLDKICGEGDSALRKRINESYELAPLAYLRGRTFTGCVCILDEAQNCTKSQLKLFLTRLGHYSKMIISGDLTQSDLQKQQSGLAEVIEKCKGIQGITHIHFTEEAIVRHRLVIEIVKRI